MDGYTNINGDEAWVRLSDVMWEWFKPLNPWQINAVKTLVSVDALADPSHPLRIQGSLELFIGIYPGGKPRLLMSLRQLEYIQYYIKAMKLIQPSPEAIQRYRDALDKLQADERERGETDSQALSEDEQDDISPHTLGETTANNQSRGQFDIAKLADVPLPSSKYFVLTEHFRPVTPAQFEGDVESQRQVEQPKRATLPQHPEDRGNAQDVKAVRPLTTAPTVDDSKGHDTAEVPSGPALLYQCAEQIYLAASQGSDYSPATFAKKKTRMPPPSGPASFLTIDLQVWEEEYGVVLDVGWSGCWFEKERSAVADKEYTWREKRGGGHWIVKENEHRLNTSMKCSIDGKITRMPYVGTGDNETLPWKQVLSKVEQLIPMVQSRANGGSLFVLVHSNDKDVGVMRQLNLPIDGWTFDVGSAMGSGTQGIFVVDTSEMVAAITNAKHKQSDPEFAAIPRSRCSLERLTGHLLKDHPVLSCVVGNSGNAADAKMECFLVMVIRGLAACSLMFNNGSPESQHTESATIDVTYEKNDLEALLLQDDADQTILLHEHARRQRQMRLHIGYDDQGSAAEDQEDGYDSEEEDKKLLEEFEMEYDISGAGPEDGIEDDY
ncbi:hypothetical protein NCC49_004215 [Naganishia albida]|nr:hypothetical protein NCC49_004215 [Naganishia albida]